MSKIPWFISLRFLGSIGGEELAAAALATAALAAVRSDPENVADVEALDITLERALAFLRERTQVVEAEER